MKDYFEIAVIGGGASGLFALRGLKDRHTLILEGNGSLGAKLLITGGSKCNFTNRSVSADNYISSNPHFAKSALAKFTPEDMLQITERHKIAYGERDKGKLFTLAGADKLLNALIKEGKSEKHTFKTGCRVKSVYKENGLFIIRTDKGAFRAEKVIMASGGLSLPKLGATGIAYKTAEKFGMRVIKTSPALTGLKYPDEIAQKFSALSGISVTASITVNKKMITDELLFTHRGFSGPLALNASLYCGEGAEITLDFAPGLDIESLVETNRNGKKSLTTLLSYNMPKALVKALLPAAEYSPAKISRRETEKVRGLIKGFKTVITEKDGYGKAEVTAGGVSVDDIFPATMESRKCPGLYFIGEALDVTGQLGGYNLHWAWASANALAEGMKR